MRKIARDSMARYGFSPATRVFEACGAGACLFSDTWKGIEEFLEPEREVIVVRDGRDLAQRLHSLMPQQSRAIGQAAYRRVLAQHTYSHRVAQLETLLDVKSALRADMPAEVL